MSGLGLNVFSRKKIRKLKGDFLIIRVICNQKIQRTTKQKSKNSQRGCIFPSGIC